MEIALSGIVILIMLLPGISFCRGYYFGEFSNQYTSTDFFALLVNTILPSILIYLAAIPFISLLQYSYDFKTLFGVISSNDNLVDVSIRNIEKFKTPIIIFQISINLFAFLIGRAAYSVVLRNSLDSRFGMLRYKNIWHYLITARFFNFRKNSDILKRDCVDDVDLTCVDALVIVNGETYIYTGVLMDYQLGKDGTLDLIIINEAQRKPLNEPNDLYKDIRGNYLVLKYADLLNLNFSFIQLDTAIDEEGNVSIHPRVIE
ncbi:MAG: hypothetical protein EOO04_12955 [Chitinophagaceae bacterium]|nr:MAG: hypothetical protein EOO04_12955 [Chitinophagaceae bacterium]